MQVNYFDMAVALVVLVLTIRGGIRGFVAEVAGLLGLIAGLALARFLTPETAQVLEGFISPSAAPTVAFVALVLAGMIGVGLVARLLQHILHMAFAGCIDHLFGAVAGAAKGALLCAALAWAAVLLMPQLSVVQEARSIAPLLDMIRWLAGSLHLAVPLP